MSGRHRAGLEPAAHKHRGEKPGRRRAQPAARQRRRHPGRAVAGIAATVGAVVLLTGPGTLAYWADAGTMSSGTFGAGTLDLTLNSNQGNPVAWANTSFAITTMVPGEAIAHSFPVQNAGTVTFTYTATGQGARGMSAFVYSIDEAGAKATVSVPSGWQRTADCWTIRADGSCV